MPSPDLQNAITRIEQAIGRAEASLQEAQVRASHNAERRDTIITEVMAEIDELVSALRENDHG